MSVVDTTIVELLLILVTTGQSSREAGCKQVFSVGQQHLLDQVITGLQLLLPPSTVVCYIAL